MTIPLTALKSLARVDGRLVVRDRFLVGMTVFLLGLSFVFRLAIPAAATAFRPDFDLETYYPLLASIVLMMFGAPLIGLIMGFVLVESREDNTLKAVMVSPFSFNWYLAYKAVTPILLGCFLAPSVALIVGVGLPSLGALIPICVVASIMAGISTIVIATFSDNKVQAFAVAKLWGANGWIPLAAYFVPEPWQYLAGIFPHYWVFKAYWLAVEDKPHWIPVLVVGAVTMSLGLWMLVRRFGIVARR